MAVRAVAAPVTDEGLSHNLLGQRLGRKGRITRDRILAATEHLLAGPRDVPISLSAVAREASLGMTTLYLYFGDLTELLLAVLDPIMATAEDSFVGRLRRRWADDDLGAECQSFIEAFYAFWSRHSRILHLRNSYASNLDERMARYRVASSMPLISLLVEQMDVDPARPDSDAAGMAVVLLTGIERLVTVVTDMDLPTVLAEQPSMDAPALLRAQARLLELGITEGRRLARTGG